MIEYEIHYNTDRILLHDSGIRPRDHGRKLFAGRFPRLGKVQSHRNTNVQLTEKYPGERDSLLTVLYEKELPSILRESRNLALKYAAVPSGLKRLFMVRLEIPKDTLSRILKSLSPEIRNPSTENACIDISSRNKSKREISTSISKAQKRTERSFISPH